MFDNLTQSWHNWHQCELLDKCRFCKKFFYGENELFKHMSERHESCFLCQRAKPNKHVYYRDYAELEGVYYSMAFLRLVGTLFVTTVQIGTCIPESLLACTINHTKIPDWQLQCRLAY